MKMGIMDILMEMYETFYQASLYPLNVQWSYKKIIPLFKELCKLTPSPKIAYTMMLATWDQAIEEVRKN